MSLFVRALHIILAIAFVVLIYKVVPWLLKLLDITVPSDIWLVIMVIIGLIAAIGALSGRWDSWWTAPKP